VYAKLQVRTECNKVIKMNLFNLHFNKSVRLEDFEQSQTQASDQANGYLKESWVVTLKNAITNTFKDSGKGWFNVQKTNHEIHDFSKLKKFLNMTKFTMEDSLRFLVEDSLLKYVVFLEKSLCPVVEVRHTNVTIYSIYTVYTTIPTIYAITPSAIDCLLGNESRRQSGWVKGVRHERVTAD
jgi:dynein heavy chain